MSAIEHWNEMVNIEHAQSDSMRKDAPPADSWRDFAQQFKADPRRTDDRLLNHLRQLVTSEQVVLDVGAGGGRLALPLALKAKKVVAVEPSPSMCRVLREASVEFGVQNVQVVESEWLGAEVPLVDVAICCHVLYVIRDIEAFVRKLEKHAKQVLVVVYQAPPQSPVYPFWEMIHGVPRLPLPSLPELLNVLEQLGVKPQVEIIHTGRNRGFKTLESAKEQLARRLYVTPDTPEMERLEALLPQVLSEIDGEYSIKGSVNLEPHVVSWQPAS